MDSRDYLARLMGLPESDTGWRPGPTSPFGGLGTYDWKNPGQPPMPMGQVPMGPSEQDLQWLHILGRRRLPSNLSGIGGTR